ncbi:hypothetical protein BC828DRAFT_395058 [Blastocladiella britannica]|nr:hypothetical protein BC828DRAFT_395058 [Blastocladiella britannica]
MAVPGGPRPEAKKWTVKDRAEAAAWLVEQMAADPDLACYLCRRTSKLGVDRFDPHPDYVVLDDLRVCCKACNYAKSDMDREQFNAHINRRGGHVCRRHRHDAWRGRSRSSPSTSPWRGAAKHWFNLGAKKLKADAGNGDRFALYWLANANRGGQLVDEDVPKALKFLERAATLGFMTMLADQHLESGVVEESASLAYEWLKKAAGQVLGIGDVRDGEAARGGDWWLLEAAADRGNIVALNELAPMHFSGEAWYAKDVPKAIDMFKCAANLGVVESTIRLGELYRDGVQRKVKVDFAEAMFWFKEAAAFGSPLAMSNIADMYEADRGVEADKNLAKERRAKCDHADDDEDWEEDCCADN